MSTGQRGDKDRAIYTCRKLGGGCGGRTIQIPDLELEPLMGRLLFKRLEEVEVAADEDPDHPRPDLEAKIARWEKRKQVLEDKLLDGDRPAREIRKAIDTLNVRMAHARRKSAEYEVKGNLHKISAAKLREAWKDYSVAWKQLTYRGLIKEMLPRRAPALQRLEPGPRRGALALAGGPSNVTDLNASDGPSGMRKRSAVWLNSASRSRTGGNLIPATGSSSG
ncbi:hypothetical protein AB0E82_05120 [Streptomyces anulatus]|uniref:hypothetical protein n=1 Tax=Streptomyces anulatus TaxID=1892 RepID=UPI0033C11252